GLDPARFRRALGGRRVARALARSGTRHRGRAVDRRPLRTSAGRRHTARRKTMKLWGGNYSADPDAAFWDFNRSFPFDQRLLVEEVTASRAYARALGKCGALPAADAVKIDDGLAQVLEKAKADPKYLDL